jgi:hypothetical protein
MIYIETVGAILKNVGAKKIVVTNEAESAPARFILNAPE